MADDPALASGVCCVICVSSIETYCLFKQFGVCQSKTNQGCCGSCLDKSFNEDAFEREERKERERMRKEQGEGIGKGVVDQQPVGRVKMDKGGKGLTTPNRDESPVSDRRLG